MVAPIGILDPTSLAIAGQLGDGSSIFDLSKSQFAGVLGGVNEGVQGFAAALFTERQLKQASVSALAQGRENARRLRRASRKRQGAFRAALGASNLALDGNTIDLFTDSAIEAELEALTAEWQAAVQAINFDNQRKQANIAKFNAIFSGINKSAAAIIGG